MEMVFCQYSLFRIIVHDFAIVHNLYDFQYCGWLLQQSMTSIANRLESNEILTRNKKYNSSI